MKKVLVPLAALALLLTNIPAMADIVVAKLCATGPEKGYRLVHEFYRNKNGVIAERDDPYAYPPKESMYQVELVIPGTKRLFRARFPDAPNGNIYLKFSFSTCDPIG